MDVCAKEMPVDHCRVACYTIIHVTVVRKRTHCMARERILFNGYSIIHVTVVRKRTHSIARERILFNGYSIIHVTEVPLNPIAIMHLRYCSPPERAKSDASSVIDTIQVVPP